MLKLFKIIINNSRNQSYRNPKDEFSTFDEINQQLNRNVAKISDEHKPVYGQDGVEK